MNLEQPQSNEPEIEPDDIKARQEETRLAPDNLVEITRAETAADFQGDMEAKLNQRAENMKVLLETQWGMSPQEALERVDEVAKALGKDVEEVRALLNRLQ